MTLPSVPPLWAAIAVALCAGDARSKGSPRMSVERVAPAASAMDPQGAPVASAVRSSRSPQPLAAPLAVKPADDEAVERTLEGHFRGQGSPSRVLFLKNTHIVSAWEEGGKERRDPITTTIPPGHRECKALRSFGSQDFLVCMYWITGPGGGRVDGVLFDPKRRIAGEFFSAAINIQLLMTLCSPDFALGPMPSFNMYEWSTKPATAEQDAEVIVKVGREGWSTQQAELLRASPATKQFCRCVDEESCPGQPTPPSGVATIVYRLSNDRLYPTAGSKMVLQQIAAQWGHSEFLGAWNLKMRGY